MESLWKHIKSNFLLYSLAAFFSWVFFYHLDYTALTSWDEGWYASIARTISRTNNFTYLYFNGKPYYDHPPFGFWTMAIAYKLFGVNEFATRLPSALAGLGTVVLLYLLGMKLFKSKAVGFVAALILGTSVWYVIRVRSGNLDSLFLFFYILTIYAATLSSTNFRWFPITLLALGALIMTKTLVGLSAVVLIVLLTFHQLINLKKNWLYIILGGVLLYLMVVPWYSAQFKAYQDFFQHHFIHIGSRDQGFQTQFNPQFWEKTLFYLHMGVRKWYYLWVVSLVYLFINSIVSVIFQIKKLFTTSKNLSIYKYIIHIYDVLVIQNLPKFLLAVWNIIILAPFLSNESTELWHLIPAYAPLSLTIAFSFYDAGKIFLESVQKINKKNSFIRRISVDRVREAFCIMVIVYLAFIQTRVFRVEVFPTTHFIPMEADILKKSSNFPQKTVHVDRDFVPIAVFYSGRDVAEQPRESSDEGTIKKLFDSEEKDFLLVTTTGGVENFKKFGIPFKVMDKNQSFVLISR